MQRADWPYRFTIACLVTCLASSAYAQIAEPYVVRDSVSGCINVREDHSVTAPTVACLPARTEVTVTKAAPYWRHVKFGANQEGWIAKKYILPSVTPPTSAQTAIPQDAILEVHFVDVGQGDAIWVQTYDDGIDGNERFEGKSIVIDGGPYSSDNENPFWEYIEDIGHHGAEIEALIVTHPHTDHYRGAETISRHFDIQHYYDPGYPSEKLGYLSFVAAMSGSSGQAPRAENIHIGRSSFGDLEWGNELNADFIYSWPGNNVSLGSGNTAINNSSIVLRIEYGEHVFLFMGDAEGKDRNGNSDSPKYVEKILLETAADQLDATVLKLGHHGSETSSTASFIDAVSPEIVIVQSGRKPYGGNFLPDSATLQRYCDHNPNIRIYRTDQGDESSGLLHRQAVDGDHIVIRSNGSGTPDVTASDKGQQISIASCES